MSDENEAIREAATELMCDPTDESARERMMTALGAVPREEWEEYGEALAIIAGRKPPVIPPDVSLHEVAELRSNQRIARRALDRG